MDKVRKDKLTRSLKVAGKGLEIGPLCWPVITKDESNIKYVDHVSTEELIRLYKDDPGITSEEIVNVDYALKGRSLQETIKKSNHFDYVIASHVIEHVPDMIEWLDDITSILKIGGRLSLAIPDKRFTFDIDRNVSRPADVVGAHIDARKKPNAVTIFDYFNNYRAKVDAGQAWAGQLYTSEEAAPHRYSLQDALYYSKKNNVSDEYIDTHCFVYTPVSFVEVMRALMELSLSSFKMVEFHDTAHGEYEFFVVLEKVGKRNTKAQLDTLPKLSPVPRERVLQNKISSLNEKVRHLEAEISDLKNSRSWKITKPVRKAAGRLRRLKR